MNSLLDKSFRMYLFTVIYYLLCKLGLAVRDRKHSNIVFFHSFSFNFRRTTLRDICILLLNKKSASYIQVSIISSSLLKGASFE